MKRSYILDPGERADRSAMIVLRQLSDVLRSTVQDVIEDSDIEALHDLRVASRRTRTVLSQLKGVFAANESGPFRQEFKWLGAVTGPCRDLDVMLATVAGSGPLPEIDAATLAPLSRFLVARRTREHTLVRAALESDRFARLVTGWEQFLSGEVVPSIEAPLAAVPIVEVVGPQILRAYRRMRKRAAGNDVDPPARLLHRLRIDGKKLRYLLELFADLYPAKTVPRCVDELKRLQDILGDFNDAVVQLALIDEFVKQKSFSEKPGAAIEPFADAIASRQQKLRDEFGDRFTHFTSAESRKVYQRTFSLR